MSKSNQNLLAVIALLVVCAVVTLALTFFNRDKADDDSSMETEQESQTEEDTENPPVSEDAEQETESEIPDETTEPELPNMEFPTELSGETKNVTITVPVQSPDGSIQRPEISIMMDVPKEWRQEEEGSGTFLFPGEIVVAENFTSTIVPQGKTIWACARLDKQPNRLTTDTMEIAGENTLYSVRWLAAEDGSEPPEGEKTYCCTYCLPREDTFLTVSFYVVGEDLEESMKMQKEILESIVY